ncbi:transposable element Tc1 transposase [Trichonephila clavipes]|nr:transposable element Tc1 transposase [Trichonephila clavipes]
MKCETSSATQNLEKSELLQLRFVKFRTAVTHRDASAPEIRSAVDTTVAKRTVRNRLPQGQIRTRPPVACLPLTPNHCRLRHQWCQARAPWRTERRSVVFSDESRFCLGASDSRVLIRRPRKRFQSNSLRPRHTGPTSGVMILIIVYPLKLLKRLVSSLESKNSVVCEGGDYIHPAQSFPTDFFLPSVGSREGSGWPLYPRVTSGSWERGYPIHKKKPTFQLCDGKTSQRALKSVDMFLCPARSPDLSSIEYASGVIGLQLQHHPLPELIIPILT